MTVGGWPVLESVRGLSVTDADVQRWREDGHLDMACTIRYAVDTSVAVAAIATSCSARTSPSSGSEQTQRLHSAGPGLAEKETQHGMGKIDGGLVDRSAYASEACAPTSWSPQPVASGVGIRRARRCPSGTRAAT